MYFHDSHRIAKQFLKNVLKVTNSHKKNEDDRNKIYFPGSYPRSYALDDLDGTNLTALIAGPSPSPILNGDEAAPNEYKFMVRHI